MTAALYSRQWNKLLPANANLNTDILVSLKQDSMNEYLTKHHQNDRSKYIRKVERTFDVGGTQRTFKLTIDAGSPIRIQLPPLGATNLRAKNPAAIEALYKAAGDWTKPDYPAPGGTPFSENDPPDANIRVFCEDFVFKLEWPKLNGGGTWSFTATIAAIAEAYVELMEDDTRTWLRIVPARIRLDTKGLANVLGKKPNPSRKGIAANQDFEAGLRDLVVIALNIVANQYAPNLVAAIPVPAFPMGKKTLNVSFLDLSSQVLTLGLTMDREALRAKNQGEIEKRYSQYLAALAQDIEAAGGLEELFLVKTKTKRGVVQSQPRPKAEVQKRLVKSRVYIQELERKARARWSRAGGRGITTSNVADGAGVAVNEYLLDSLLSDALPNPVDDCTGWLDLGVARGRICWWMRMFNPDAAINGTTVSGHVEIDIGGKIEACIKKVWDCSWSWECGSLLTLAVVGRPGIQFELVHGRGVTFRGKVVGSLRLETNLPFPFDRIVSALAQLVIDAVIAIVNAVASAMLFEIVLPELVIADQRTKVVLGPFSPFPYTRPTSPSLPASRKVFVGFSVGVTATM